MNFRALLATNFRPLFNPATKNNILLFALVLNLGGPVSAIANISFQQPIKQTKANQIQVNNPEWVKGLFPFEPETTPYAKTYTTNLTLAAAQFRDLFFKSDFKTESEFIRILQLNHKKAVDGVTPNKPYAGEQSLEEAVNIIVQAVHADPKDARKVMLEHRKSIGGRFRAETDLDFTPALTLGPYIGDIAWPARQQQVAKLYDKTIRIAGVPSEGLPVNDFSGKTLYHAYPNPKYYPYYLRTMQQLMFKIRNCNNCSQEQVLSYLADYYHAGTNAHLFPRTNHSLLMAHVNVIMMQMGLSPLPHWLGEPISLRIDIAALMVNPEKFRKMFIQEVARQNQKNSGH